MDIQSTKTAENTIFYYDYTDCSDYFID